MCSSARLLKDLKYFVNMIIDLKPFLYYPKIPPVLERPYEFRTEVCFGILKDNGATYPHP